MSTLVLATPGVVEAMRDRLPCHREFRSIVFTASSSDALAAIEELVIGEANGRGGATVIEHSQLRDKLALGTSVLDGWKRMVSDSPRKGYLVLKNPSGAMRDWPESSVRRAWSFLSRVETHGIVVLDSVGPVHEDGFACIGRLGGGVRFAYAEGDEERGWRWRSFSLSPRRVAQAQPLWGSQTRADKPGVL